MFLRCLVITSLAACGRFGFEERVAPPGDATPDAPLLVTCESRTALPVPTTGRVSGTIAMGAGDQGSCSGSDSTEDVYAIDVLVPGSRIQVAADDPAQTAVPALYVRTDCDDAATELECDLTDGINDRPQITRAVAPGRYFVFIDGQLGMPGGDYDATLTVLLPVGASCDPSNARDRCDGSLECVAGTCQPSPCPIAMSFDGPGPHAFTTSTTGGINRHAGTCGDANDGGLRAPELIIKLTLATGGSIHVDTDLAGTDYDSLVYIRDACNGTELACDDDTGLNNHAIADTGTVPPGTYFIFIDGFATRSGSAQVSITAN